MKFANLFVDQIKTADTVKNATRSNKILIPMHKAIADFISENSHYHTQSLPDSEYTVEFDYGSKKVDIALLDEKNNLKGVILFKGIRSEYNKNSNNYYEQMKGESSLFIDNNIPVYQIILIPTQVHHKNSRGEHVFETPTDKSFNNYNNFVNNKPSYWDLLKLGVFYFDVDYNNYSAVYSVNKIIDNMESTLSEGLLNFIKKVDAYGQSKTIGSSNDAN